MILKGNSLYHVFSRGNDRNKVFLTSDNYLFFIKKIRIHLNPIVDVLGYCLMPNHFHLLIYCPSEESGVMFNSKYATLLSSYTRAVNNATGRTGSIFQKRSKYIEVLDEDYAVTCFLYIHQNPLVGSVVERLEDWLYSSFPDYAGLRQGNLCNKQRAYELLDLPSNNQEFVSLSYRTIPPEKMQY